MKILHDSDFIGKKIKLIKIGIVSIISQPWLIQNYSDKLEFYITEGKIFYNLKDG